MTAYPSIHINVSSLLFVLALLICLSWSSGEDNLYKILGVTKTATVQEIKRAYRRKALDTHPDKRKDIPAEQAAAEFHKVVQAFEILSDDNSRRNYDRTGRTTQQQQHNGGGSSFHGFGGGFHFHFNYGGGSRKYQRPRLKDQFKVREAMSRVMHVVSLSQLETVLLDENGVLERNLLMVFVTPGDVETICDDEMVFPYPFAAMSEQGIWWEELLQTVKIRYNKINGLTRFFGIPEGDTLRNSKQPIFMFGRRGQQLSAEFPRIQTSNRKDFEAWVWSQIEVTVTFRNDHSSAVELFWIHGRTAHDKGTLQPGESQTHTTMLTHEWWVRDARVDTRKDSPGRHKLSKESMVAIWKITSDELQRELVIPPKACLDLSGHCTWWRAQNECTKNPFFMEETCALSCGHCSEANDTFKSYNTEF